MKTAGKQILIMLAFLLLGAGGRVLAESTIKLNVTAQYGQTEAREQLDMINAFRTGADAWYWSEDNKTQVRCTNLKKLQWDYELEKAAMLRAMENAIYYDHGRPNGGSTFDLFTGNGRAENITAGYTSSQDVFMAWREDNDKYAGQGHRRNMLGQNYGAVAVGHVYYNGCHFWVQLFRDSVGSSTYTTPNDSVSSVDVDVLPSNITDKTFSINTSFLSIPYGDSADLPEATINVRLTKSFFKSSFPVKAGTITWSVDDTSVARINGNKIEALRIGSTTVHAYSSFIGDTVSIPLIVTKIPVDGASVTLSQDSYVYDGIAKTPEVLSVIVKGKKLNVGTDYTVSYSANVDAGTASVDIQGIGLYEGTYHKRFTIVPANIEEAVVSDIEDQIYAGMFMEPDFSVTYRQTILKQNVDYTVEYKDNVNVGTAEIQITARGNYTGKISKTFQILQADIAACDIEELPLFTYEGIECKPEPQINLDNPGFQYVLKKDVDFILSYENNINAGTAQMTVRGIGNFYGEVTSEFTILRKNLGFCEMTGLKDLKVMYTGEPVTPPFEVKDGERILKAGENGDYTFEYSFNENVEDGPATITATGIGNYKDTLIGTFTILPVDINNCEISDIPSHEYDGENYTPELEITYHSMILNGKFDSSERQDYTVIYHGVDRNYNLFDVGTLEATVCGEGNYTGERLVSYEITKADIGRGTLDFDDSPKVYNGLPHEPWDISVFYNGKQLDPFMDYEVKLENNLNASKEGEKAKVTISGINNYKGELVGTFEILPLQLTDMEITVGEIPEQLYIGEPLTPEVSVLYHDTPLQNGIDYTVSYADNMNRGTASAIVTGINNFAGTVTRKFEIRGIQISDCKVEPIPSHVYDGKPYEPEIIVMAGERRLKQGTDYTVTYENAINAGNAKAILVGSENYPGTLEVDYKIEPADFTKVTLNEFENVTYTGEAISPEVVASCEQGTLVEDVDYTVSYDGNVNAGTARVSVTGMGNYQGTLEREFQILPVQLEESMVGEIADQAYMGEELMPDVTVIWNERRLERGKDYTVSYKNNREKGTATATVTGTGNFSGTFVRTFEIFMLNIQNCQVEIPSHVYDGTEYMPEIKVVYGTQVLQQGIHYEVSYSGDRINAGTVGVTINGIGICEGTLSTSFEIIAANIDECGVDPVESRFYNGKPYEPELTVRGKAGILAAESDYRVRYENSTNAGTASAFIEGLGNYTGEKEVNYTIEQIDIRDCVLSVIEEDQVYTGEKLMPALTVTNSETGVLTIEKDYKVSYDQNVDVGRATVTVTGVGNYKGTLTGEFSILPRALTDDMVVFEVQPQIYTGTALEPAIAVSYLGKSLVPGEDYTVTYHNNENVGKADIDIKLQGNYTGNLHTDFQIEAANLEGTAVLSEIPVQLYTGAAIEPEVTVSYGTKALKKGTDYTVAYNNHVNVGEASVTVEGIGNYTGTLRAAFQIKYDISKGTVAFNDQKYKTAVFYTGAAFEPEVTVTHSSRTLQKGKDYTVSYMNNVNAGTAKVTVSGMGDYLGECGATFQIRGASIISCTVEPIPDQIYTGSIINPKPVVKFGETVLREGEDYNLSYNIKGDDYTSLGIHKLVISGKGNFMGTTEPTFKIVAPGTTDPGKEGEGNPGGAQDDSGNAGGATGQGGSGNAGGASGQGGSGNAGGATGQEGSGNTGNTSGQGGSGSTGGNTSVSDDPETAGDVGDDSTGKPGDDKNNSEETESKTPVSPAKGTKLKSSTAQYKITQKGGSGSATVEYLAPVNAKKTSVAIPSTITVKGVKYKVTSVANKAFANNKKLKSVTIGGNVTSIGNQAFSGCTSLKTVIIGNKVKSIGQQAFNGCKNLKQITLGKNITSIGKQAFNGCRNLKKITLKTTKLTQKSIGAKAFAGIYAKAVVKVPASKVKQYKKWFRARGLGAKAKVTK